MGAKEGDSFHNSKYLLGGICLSPIKLPPSEQHEIPTHPNFNWSFIDGMCVCSWLRDHQLYLFHTGKWRIASAKSMAISRTSDNSWVVRARSRQSFHMVKPVRTCELIWDCCAEERYFVINDVLQIVRNLTYCIKSNCGDWIEKLSRHCVCIFLYSHSQNSLWNQMKLLRNFFSYFRLYFYSFLM